MGRTLGINDDYWHGLIPLIAQPVIICTVYSAYGWGLVTLLTWLIVVMCLYSLHFTNEWLQAVDPYVTVKYGDLKGFQINSRKDTKLFLVGLFLGSFLSVFIMGVL